MLKQDVCSLLMKKKDTGNADNVTVLLHKHLKWKYIYISCQLVQQDDFKNRNLNMAWNSATHTVMTWQEQGKEKKSVWEVTSDIRFLQVNVGQVQKNRPN